jgi:8-oxo-dGTP pyrophosphatase MutT (NUDIX family)
MESNPWKIVSSEIKYDNAWIQIEEHQVINPAGKNGIYGEVHFKNMAVAIVPLDEENNTYIVGQYRFPVKSYEWEVVEGGCPKDEIPLQTAQRELREEVGLEAKEYKLIQEVQLSNCTTDELGYIFVAKGLIFVGMEHEETEVLKVKKIPFDELFEMALNGEIKDNFSLTAIYKVKFLMQRGEL